jgi:predicted naringenin-chalcone synthase
MFIRGIGTATPPNRFAQREGWDAVQRSPFLAQLSSRSLAILRKVLTGDTGIQTRHFVLGDLQEAFALDPNTLHRRFADNAPVLGEAAARKAAEQAGVRLTDIDALIVSTCTGYLCPGLTSYISERLGLRPNIYLADLVGHGCGAALPNLRLADALLKSGQAAQVLCVCVEICSAAFYFDNDPGVLISACLFGDGAGALVVGKDAGPNLPAIEWIDSESVLNPRDRELLRFETRDGMLRNILDKSVPVLVVDHVRQVLDVLLERHGMQQEDLAAWIVHAGGRDVLVALERAFGLRNDALKYSAAVLREYGNVSSPSVIFALEQALKGNAPAGRWFFTSFGAGISCHGAFLDVRH